MGLWCCSPFPGLSRRVELSRPSEPRTQDVDAPAESGRTVVYRHPPDFPWEWGGNECQYPPLKSSSEIRVVKNLRIGIMVERVGNRTTYSPEFACELEVVDLDHLNDTIFTALSYSWGSPFPDSYPSPNTFEGEDDPEEAPPRETFHMYCNGGTINITKNLHDFLYSGCTRLDALLWIDAISINQKDIAERNAQVAMMDRIYAKATAVLAWLGPHDSASETAVQLIQNLAKGFESMPETERPVGYYVFNDPKFFAQLGMHITDAEWDAIILFFSRTWFRRIWMVQEVAFAARLYFACGGQEMQWTLLSAFVSWISDMKWDVELKHHMLERSIGGDVLGTELLEQVLDIGLSVRAALGSARTREVVQLMFGIEDRQKMIAGVFGLLLFRNQHRWATDPRDKVYGVLGMVKSYQEGETPSTIPVPDYSKPTRQVFQESFELILQNSSSLGVLSMVDHSEDPGLSNMPTWVADWSRTRARECLVMHKCHDASHSWPFSPPRIEKVKNHLLVEGIHIDSIASVSELLGSAIGVAHDLMAVITPAFHVRDSYITGQHSFEVLFQVLVQDCFKEDRKDLDGSRNRAYPYEHVKDSFQSWLKLNIAERSYTQGFPIPVLKADEEIGEYLESTPLFPAGDDIVAYYQRYVEIMEEELAAEGWNRQQLVEEILTPTRLFAKLSLATIYRRLLTTEGKLLGLAPPIAQTGDQIWILRGGRVPFVVRPQPNGHFRLIGEAYVHGYMRGEAFTRDKMSKESAVTLTLE